MNTRSDQKLVLAVDDDPEALMVLQDCLVAEGYLVHAVGSGEEALRFVENSEPDLVLLDINLPGKSGFEVVRELKAQSAFRYVPVMLQTALEGLSNIVRGLDDGADGYLVKPYERAELLARVRSALRIRATYCELRAERRARRGAESQLLARRSPDGMAGQSRAMRDIASLIERVKNADAPVLILGESGTGKELVARALHFESERRDRPFVVQNCSALQESLLESELFGHVRGAFTGAVRDKEGLLSVADGGTFFLDELGEMSPALQVKLLRVIQQGTFTPVGGVKEVKVKVRIVAATHRDLHQMMQQGRFREDLYYRLNVVSINLPPLRERREDIPAIVDHIMRRFAARGVSVSLEPGVIEAFLDYTWPGNIRELENEIERMVLLGEPERPLGIDLVSKHIVRSRSALEADREGGAAVVGGSLREALSKIEAQLVTQTLQDVGGNKSEAARRLGISRSSLIAKAQALGLAVGRSEDEA